MQHRLKLKKSERLEIWLELCDFSYRLMAAALTPRQLEERLARMRQEHLEDDAVVLRAMAKVK